MYLYLRADPAGIASLESFPAAEGSSVIIVKADRKLQNDPATSAEIMQATGMTHLDLVIATGGIQRAHDSEEAEDDDEESKMMDELFAVNTLTRLTLFTVTYPYLKAASDAGRHPQLVGISTTAASVDDMEATSSYMMGAYGASKATLNHLVRQAHEESDWLTAFVVEVGLVKIAIHVITSLTDVPSLSFVQSEMGDTDAEGEKQQPIVTLRDNADGILKLVGRPSQARQPEISTMRADNLKFVDR